MDQTTIERVDSLPLVITWMEHMQLAATIDQHWQPHRGWTGRSYGQLTVLFIAFMLQQREHRLSYFEDWLHQHQHVIHATTGWTVGPKEGTDDRLGILLQTLGSSLARSAAVGHGGPVGTLPGAVCGDCLAHRACDDAGTGVARCTLHGGAGR